jgi:uncharacterized membrane protein (Fun14 family)
METAEFDGLLQSFKNFIRNPHILHASAAMLLGAGAGLFFRIILKIALVYVACVVVLFVVLQSSNVLSVQIDPQQINHLVGQLAKILQRFRLQNYVFLPAAFSLV